MQNVWTVALRPAGLCLRSSPLTTAPLGLHGALPLLARCARTSGLHPVSRLDAFPWAPSSGVIVGRKTFSTTSRCEFQPSSNLRKLKVYAGPQKIEQGLRFRDGNLDERELYKIFGKETPPPNVANRLLRILHARRVDGTLDIQPPQDILRQLNDYPHASADGLTWLRKNYPMDEDAAIIARIEREEAPQEKENPAELVQRAGDLGLYKPQSGKYGAKLGKKGDVFGVSELDRIRAENEAKAKQEEEAFEARIERTMAETNAKAEAQAAELKQLTTEVEDKAGHLIPGSNRSLGLEDSRGLRPPNVYERWNMKNAEAAISKLTADSPEIANMTKTRRILPSLLFTATGLLACYILSQYWTPPARLTRLWPSTSLAWATIFGLATANIAIFCLWWGFSPAWRLLNKYFIVVTATPVAGSMLGSVFSHQQGMHLLFNMGFLVAIPLAAQLCEEVGRGTFLAVYLASGLLGSFVPLTVWVLRGQITQTCLGASGAVMGVLAAYCTINGDRQFTTWLLPEAWKEHVHISGWTLVAAILVLEVLGFARPRLRRILTQLDRTRYLKLPDRWTKQIARTNHLGHLSGFGTGLVCGLWIKQNREEEKRRIAEGREREEMWFEKIFGRRPDR